MEMTLMQALRKIGVDRREGQSLAQFAAEIKSLTDADRKWFAERFAVEHGITVTLAQPAAA